MAFRILNDPSAGVSPAGSTFQAQVDSADIDIVVASEMGTGVQSGGAVTVVSGMQVNCAAGTDQIQGGTNITVPSTNLTLAAADGAQPRFDLIYVPSGGTPAILQGTPGAAPDFPALSKDGNGNVNVVYHAAILVPAGAASIAAGNITDKRTTLSPLLADTGWIAITGGVGYTNSWVDFGGGVEDNGGYRKIGNIVRCRGMIKSGTLGQIAFTLPAGFRPTGGGSNVARRFGAMSNNAAGGLKVDSTGAVFPVFGSNVWIDLSCIEFTVD